jgi:hypothetical protein
MARANPSDLEVEGWLKAVGIESIGQWDVLVFLYGHPTCLISAEHIARLVGHSTGNVVAALDRLESLALVKRSRVEFGVRLYQFARPAAQGPADALARLLTLANSRTARLLLWDRLRRGNAPDQDSARDTGPDPLQQRSAAHGAD